MYSLFLWLFLFVLSSSAAPAEWASPTIDARAAPLPTICGDIVNSCDNIFTAKRAYECLSSVPFNPAVASNFIKYVNDTIQFQSTLAYLKNPPSSYQQPAVDLVGGLQRIQQDIDQGAFHNQYAFEATLQSLIYAAHDSHLQLASGILAAFSFLSPYSLVSLSEDGVQEPKVYVADDLYLAQQQRSTFKESAIASINGRNTTDYLMDLAAQNSIGNVEPNTDWNALMSSWAAYIQGYGSVMETLITFYPGEDIALTFENGTQLDPKPWMAIYNSPGPTGPLATGGDFYNFFVLGFYPDSFNASAPDPCAASTDNTGSSGSLTNTSSTAIPTATSWLESAYPDTPDIYQPNLYPQGYGFVTGYFLRDISTAVLSIPTFEISDNDTSTFSRTIVKFLAASHQAGMQKILIDLQQNFGGRSLLAIDVFKKFFPNNDTFRGDRFRAHPIADVLGTTLTGYFQNSKINDLALYDALVGNVWVTTDRLDAQTNQNFTSWAQSFGPHKFNGDFFSTVERENISSTIVDIVELGEQIDGSDENNNTIPRFYDPQNIAILTDGVCASTCAIFVEIMRQGAGVRTIVAGGLPHIGPMQAAGGTRGYQDYSSDQLNDDIATVELLNGTTIALLPNRSVDTFITAFQVNIRDQMRKNVDTPVQFLYDAADCRIYFTAETWKNYTALWTYASNAIFGNNTLCVPGSTGHTNPIAGDSTFAPLPENRNRTLSDPTYAFDPARFTNSTNRNFEEGYIGPPPKSIRPIKKPPTRHDISRKPCPVGTCKSYVHTRVGPDQSRLIVSYSDPYSPNVNAPTETRLHELFTESDQAYETHGDARRHDGIDDVPIGKLIMAGFSK